MIATVQMNHEPELKFVVIRASAEQVAQLRKMLVDIFRLSAIGDGPTPATKEQFLETPFTVEAVVSQGLLAKLRDLGFDVTEVPYRRNRQESLALSLDVHVGAHYVAAYGASIPLTPQSAQSL